MYEEEQSFLDRRGNPKLNRHADQETTTRVNAKFATHNLYSDANYGTE